MSAPPAIHTLDVIRTKRDGRALDDEQIRWFIDRFARDEIPAEQASALLMAIVWRGLDPRELATWTGAMIDSGTRLDLSTVTRPTVDKHSTGGVGDKISLPLCAVAAACGLAVPQLSGRGLGHTGGTLDKMESLSGWTPHIDPTRFVELLDTVGAVIAAASDDLAPADRRMYALRDVTGTVESIPLIASSIMSKKIAEGTKGLVLDVKYGSGAFMSRLDDAVELAETMVGIGGDHGVATTALVTDMDQPLGRAVGNAVEVAEAIDVLRGGGPPDVVALTVALAEEMIDLAARRDPSASFGDPARALLDGSAMGVWRSMVTAQGGDPDEPLPRGDVEPMLAERGGVVRRIDARAIGDTAWRLGAGRDRPGATVSATAGVVLCCTAGDVVSVGDTIAELHIDDATRVADALDAFAGAIEIGDVAVERRPLIERVIR